MINIPKGTKDVLPQDSYRSQYVEGKVREFCHIYGFREIRTPTFEHTELFLRSMERIPTSWARKCTLFSTKRTDP